MKLAYVIPVSVLAARLVHLVVPGFCLCHTYAGVPDWSTDTVTANVPAPLDEVEFAGWLPLVRVMTSSTSAPIVSSACVSDALASGLAM